MILFSKRLYAWKAFSINSLNFVAVRFLTTGVKNVQLASIQKITSALQPPAVQDERCEIEEAEPAYGRDHSNTPEEVILYSSEPFQCQYGSVLPDLNISYESWGNLNDKKDNVILLQHGLSASPHARSHLERNNSRNGWWEKFIGPGLSLDTNKFCVICVNMLGSCYGTTGPSTINKNSGKPFGGDFPIISISDMVRVQFSLLDMMGIDKIHSVVGASLGGLASFMSGALFMDRIDRLVSISAGGNSGPSSIAFRYLQREALMSDPKWNNGHYYDKQLPVDGTQLARKIATLTYRSGPEWEQRFKSEKVKHDVELPRYDGAEFLIEDYIRHQGESFMEKTKFDPNSLIYLSKAMDIFDMSEGYDSMEEGFSRVKCPILIMGASSDILYPISKQKEAARCLSATGNKEVTLHIEDGFYGHDTFLLDVKGMGSRMKVFLET